MPLLALLAAVAGSPWNLRCPAMPAEQQAPAAIRAATHAFYPWAGHAGAAAVHAGPVWLLALSAHTAISRDGDGRDAAGRYLHRALVAVGPSYARTVTIRGRRLGRPGPRTRLRFTDGASRCTVSTPNVSCGPAPLTEKRALNVPAGRGEQTRGWRVVRTEIAIGRTGCFTLRATGAGLAVSLPLAVPGPDWGTPGWDG